MKIKKEEAKVKPQLKLSDDFFDLRTLDTNIIIKHMEYNIKLRELSVEKRLAEKLKEKD